MGPSHSSNSSDKCDTESKFTTDQLNSLISLQNTGISIKSYVDMYRYYLIPVFNEYKDILEAKKNGNTQVEINFIEGQMINNEKKYMTKQIHNNLNYNPIYCIGSIEQLKNLYYNLIKNKNLNTANSKTIDNNPKYQSQYLHEIHDLCNNIIPGLYNDINNLQNDINANNTSITIKENEMTIDKNTINDLNKILNDWKNKNYNLQNSINDILYDTNKLKDYYNNILTKVNITNDENIEFVKNEIKNLALNEEELVDSNKKLFYSIVMENDEISKEYNKLLNQSVGYYERNFDILDDKKKYYEKINVYLLVLYFILFLLFFYYLYFFNMNNYTKLLLIIIIGFFPYYIEFIETYLFDNYNFISAVFYGRVYKKHGDYSSSNEIKSIE
jgi:hypothetical protein